MEELSKKTNEEHFDWNRLSSDEKYRGTWKAAISGVGRKMEIDEELWQ